MAIAFRAGANTAYASHTNITITKPTGTVDGDVMVAAIATGVSGTAPTVSLTGWTAFGTATLVSSGGFSVRLTIFWKRALSEGASYTFVHTAASSAGWIGSYSGALASGTPLSATSNNNGTGFTSTGTGITTTAANSFLLWLGHDFADTTNNLTPPSGMTERLDAVLIYAADELRASAAATGNRTMTNNNEHVFLTSPWAVRMVELLVDTGGGGSTGTLSITEDADTVSGTATLSGPVGTATITEAADTISSTAALSGPVGTATITEAADTLSATGAITITGTASIAEADDTLSATGTQGAISIGTANLTEAADTIAASGTVSGAVIIQQGGRARYLYEYRRRRDLEDEDEAILVMQR